MPNVKITKKDVETAKKAREVALRKDPEFRDYVGEMEKIIEEAVKQQEKEVK